MTLCENKQDYGDKIENFADYDLLNYINNEEINNYVFPLALQNHYDSEKRSNNDLEGYNSKLEKFLSSLPNVWVFINKIKAEESTATLKYMRTTNAALAKRNRNTVDVERDLKIQTAKIDLLTNKITTMEFLDEDSEIVCNYDEL